MDTLAEPPIQPSKIHLAAPEQASRTDAETRRAQWREGTLSVDKTRRTLRLNVQSTVLASAIVASRYHVDHSRGRESCVVEFWKCSRRDANSLLNSSCKRCSGCRSKVQRLSCFEFHPETLYGGFPLEMVGYVPYAAPLISGLYQRKDYPFWLSYLIVATRL